MTPRWFRDSFEELCKSIMMALVVAFGFRDEPCHVILIPFTNGIAFVKASLPMVPFSGLGEVACCFMNYTRFLHCEVRGLELLLKGDNCFSL